MFAKLIATGTEGGMLYVAGLTLCSLLAGAFLATAGIGPAGRRGASGICRRCRAADIRGDESFCAGVDAYRRPCSPWIARLPWLAQAAGLLAVLAMQGLVPYWLLYGAATVDLVLAAVLLNWMAARARASLGSPHPGWRWYGAALGCLMLALLAILLTAIWPAYWYPLRLFHLHLNTIGLVGLAALGTLPVLMPTVLGKPDPEAAGWLHRRLWLVAGGALVVATGAAVVWPFAAPGAALVLVAALGLVGQWVRRFGIRPLLADGISASLLAAVVGLLLTLAAGVAHGAGLLPARPSLLAWGPAFSFRWSAGRSASYCRSGAGRGR